MRFPKHLVALVVLCALARAADTTPADNKLWQYRNLGKAFYENPDTHLQAVDALHSALELAPDSVEERINYGLALLRAGRNDEAVKELTEAQKQDPSLPYTWFNLGIFYKHAGDYEKAMEQLRGMIRLRPDEPIAHYNLASVLRSKGDLQDALPEFLEAEKLNPNLAGPHFQLFSLYQRTGKREEAAAERKEFEAAKKRDEGAAVPEDMEWCYYAELYDPPDPRPYPASEPTKYEDRQVASGIDGMALIDADGSGRPDLIAWSAKGVSLYKNGVEKAAGVGLDDLSGVKAIAVGDYDNDGFADLAVLTASGVTLFHNDHGKFSKASALPNTAGATALLWLDYDHDYDLDLLAFGENPVLLRNVGGGKFEDHSAGFPFVKGKALDAAVFAVRGDTAARDFVVSYADRPATLYRDRLNEKFETQEIPALAAGSAGLSVQDINHDGLLDIVSYMPSLHAARNENGLQFVEAKDPKAAPSATLADFNGDFREDHADIVSGSLHLYTNASPTQHWSTVRINGIKNLKLAPGATVEVKSGIFYDKRVYAGVPIAFALDGHSDFDTVRITWPNGLIQNEIHQKSNAALNIAEAQRLSGSCPMIFTWNGKEFQFITDVLGVAPLGASSGDGSYFPVDHDEYIQIPGSAIEAVDGKYQVHITEELHEVSYLDKVQLIAVDHPADIEIYTNDKFKSPPYPEFRLFGSSEKIHPVHATEGNGVEATARVARQDHTYPDTFAHNDSGVAEMHTLDLDFGDAAKTNRAALVLNGWVDWADGSTFLGAAQNGKGGLTFPYLQVKDAQGKWKTVVEDMGIPSGKPKTMVVDLTGKFLSKSREVRIVTNLCVYWDEIFLIDNAGSPPARLTQLEASSADLNFRGFSKVVVDPMRQQPERFVYSEVRPVSNWNPTPGRYTRYGDVTPLVNKIDDKLIVMGSGDELKLSFPAVQLPALPSGWSRDFLLLVDGWAKDSDANTAFSQSVLPLPFHGMSSYPYSSNEHFPDDPEHARYIDDYLTRPALELIRPLAPKKGLD